LGFDACSNQEMDTPASFTRGRALERRKHDSIQGYLAQAGLINQATLVARFESEMEPYRTGPTPTWHRTTLNMWMETGWAPEPGDS
jgi:hypothetical protein